MLNRAHWSDSQRPQLAESSRSEAPKIDNLNDRFRRMLTVDSAYSSGMGAATVMTPVGVGCATSADLEYS